MDKLLVEIHFDATKPFSGENHEEMLKAIGHLVYRGIQQTQNYSDRKYASYVPDHITFMTIAKDSSVDPDTAMVATYYSTQPATIQFRENGYPVYKGSIEERLDIALAYFISFSRQPFVLGAVLNRDGTYGYHS